jgi:hypothetical protein
LAKLFDQVRPGDTVVVWRLDRLGRFLRHLIDTVNALSERKVGFRSLTGWPPPARCSFHGPTDTTGEPGFGSQH